MKFYLILCVFIASFALSSQRPNEPAYEIETRNDLSGSLLQIVESSPFMQQLRDTLIIRNEIVDLILPVMVRAITSPVPGLADALQKSMALFGVTSYLVGPTIARSARELGPVVEPIVGSTDGIVKKINQASELQPLFDNVLTILGINNDQCKEAITCQAGKAVARDYPILARYLSQTTSQTRSAEDKFANILVNIMSSGDLQCTSECTNLALIEKYWRESGEKDFLTLARDAISNTLK